MADENLFAAARRASKLSQANAASICGISSATYGSREKTPGDFRLCELVTLYQHLGESSREILVNAVTSLFLSA